MTLPDHDFLHFDGQHYVPYRDPPWRNQLSDPHLLLTGQTLALGIPRREMLPAYHAWENDPGTLMGFGNQLPQSWETRASGWDRQRGNMNFPQFEVVRLEDAEPVGMTTLDINRFVRTAEFVMVLAPGERGKGMRPRPRGSPWIGPSIWQRCAWCG